MSEIKISNELLSLVLGCECEFQYMNKEFGETDVQYSFIDNDRRLIDYSINIFEFINLAKIKAFECGYMVVELNSDCAVYDISDTRYTEFYTNQSSFDFFQPKRVIECLEWVEEQVGEKNE